MQYRHARLGARRRAARDSDAARTHLVSVVALRRLMFFFFLLFSRAFNACEELKKIKVGSDSGALRSSTGDFTRARRWPHLTRREAIARESFVGAASCSKAQRERRR